MIHLEIINSSEPLALGLYEYEFDHIRIGRSKKNDLIFLEPEIPLKYLILRIVNNQLIVQSFKRSSFFFVNGKKVSGTLKLHPNDVLAFGVHQIRIIKSAQTSATEDFSSIYEDFIKEASELKFALDFIEEVLIEIEGHDRV